MNKVVKNYIYNMIYQILMIILPIVTIPYLTRTLGANNLGIERYVESVVTIFSVVGLLGLNVYSNRTIAYERGDKKGLSKCFFEIFFMRTILLVATLIFYFIFTAASPYSEFYKIFSIFLIGTFLDVTWLFTGLEEMKPVVVRNTTIRIISTICLFIFVKNPSDVGIYIWITSLTIFANAIIMFPFCKKYIVKVRLKDLNMIRHIVPALALFLPQAATQIYVQCDKVMIKALVSDISWVSFYSENEKVVKMPIVMASALSTVLMPRLANEFAVGNKDAVKNYIQKSFVSIIIVLVPCAVGVSCVAKRFIPLFLGPEFGKTYGLVILLSPIIIFIGLSNVTGVQYLVSTNKTKELTISYVSAALINLIINFMLIPKLDAYGAAIGTVIAEGMVFIIQYKYMIKYIGKLECKSIIIKTIISGAIMGVAVYLVSYLPFNNNLVLVLQVITGIVVYALCMYIVWKNKKAAI